MSITSPRRTMPSGMLLRSPPTFITPKSARSSPVAVEVSTITSATQLPSRLSGRPAVMAVRLSPSGGIITLSTLCLYGATMAIARACGVLSRSAVTSMRSEAMARTLYFWLHTMVGNRQMASRSIFFIPFLASFRVQNYKKTHFLPKK